MLDTTTIATLISDPSGISASHLDDLKMLSEKYPFTPVFSQLYLKGLSKFNPIAFEEELKMHAYRIPDRTQLYTLIHFAERNNINFSEHVAKEVEKEEDVYISEVVSTPEKEPEEIKPVASFEIDEKDEETASFELEDHEVTNVIDENSMVVQKEPEEEKPAEEIRETREEEKPAAESESKPQKPKSKDSLERDILAHAVSSSISFEIDEEFAGQETFKIDYSKLNTLGNLEEDQLPEVDIEFGIQKEEKLSSNNQDKEEPVERDENRHASANSKLSFTDWLKPFSAGKQAANDQTENVKSIPENDDEGNKRLEIRKKIQEISEETKARKEFFSPTQKAKESLDETRLPVSETLAKVYVAQGNYPKAIEAYDKLMLKFPEKKSFFALQIESLKRKLN